MVDSVQNPGGIQNISTTDKSPKQDIQRKKDSTTEGSKAVQDNVTISKEALTLAQVESTAKDIAEHLANNTPATLSSDNDRLRDL